MNITLDCKTLLHNHIIFIEGLRNINILFFYVIEYYVYFR